MSWLEYLSYNPDTGVFTWKKSPANVIKIGSVAGTVEKEGYVRIILKGKSERAHRLAWLFTHGELPIEFIDHINRNKGDNRLVNLRLASAIDNALNRGAGTNNKSGHKGVWWCKLKEKWKWQVTYSGKTKCGTSLSMEEAIEQSTACRQHMHQSFAHA